MATTTSLKQQAGVIASNSLDPQVQALARIVEQLCGCVDYAGREAHDAKEVATRASCDARDARREAKK
jgi:hypothetical protein